VHSSRSISFRQLSSHFVYKPYRTFPLDSLAFVWCLFGVSHTHQTASIVINTLDCSGGGFTIVLHCSGVLVPSNIENMSPTDVVVDAYIPPNETHHIHVQRHVVKLAQLFREGISISHLQRLHTQCKALDITIPSNPHQLHLESQSNHLTLILL
jgi:hypothetical protein